MKAICDLVDAFFDAEVTAAQWYAFAAHLPDCHRCQTTLHDLALLRALLLQWVQTRDALTQ